MKGYKAFNPDLTCRGYQFTTDDIHTFDGTPILCEQGFHFCTTLEDVVKYYYEPDMRVFEIKAISVIANVEEDCSNLACSGIQLIKEISLNEVMLSITKSEPAYLWARFIGSQDIMIDKITDSKYAYYWACDIGNKDVMKSRVTELEWIKEWNYFFRDDQII